MVLDYNEIKYAIQRKETFDALCLAILIKSKYTNSILYSHSVRELKEITHLGRERYNACIAIGLKVGYFSRQKEDIKVRKFHIGSQRFIKIPKGIMTMTEIRAFLRKQLIINRANQISWVKNIVNKGQSDSKKVSKRVMDAYRKLQNQTTMDLTSTDTIGTITNKTLAKFLHCSVTSVHTLLKQLVKEGKIRIVATYKELDLKKKLPLYKGYIPDYEGDFFVIKHEGKTTMQMGNTIVVL